jgi:hypothetical protein
VAGETFKIAEEEEAEEGEEVTAAAVVDEAMDSDVEEVMAEEVEEELHFEVAEEVRRRRFSREKNHISLTRLISLQPKDTRSSHRVQSCWRDPRSRQDRDKDRRRSSVWQGT